MKKLIQKIRRKVNPYVYNILVRLMQATYFLLIGLFCLLAINVIVYSFKEFVRYALVPDIWCFVVLLLIVFVIIALIASKRWVDNRIKEAKDDITHYERVRQRKKETIERIEYEKVESNVFNTEQTEYDDDKIRNFETQKIEKGGEEKLNKLIGLSSVKTQVARFQALVKYDKNTGSKKTNANYHMIFSGNPGTGKTTVANAIGSILYDTKIITKPKMIIVNGNDLMGKYMGQTAPTIDKLFKQADGGLIFIDEAYSLVNACWGVDNQGYGVEAVNQLLTYLEDPKNKTVVIFAGYEDEMNRFLNMNPGLRSRIPTRIKFEDYTPDELYQILELELKKRGHNIKPELKSILIKMFEGKINLVKTYNQPFSNGRYARNIADEIHAQHAVNYLNDKSIGTDICKSDIDFKTLINID